MFRFIKIFIRKRKNFSELAWVFLGQFVSILFGFAITKVLTQMGTTEYGIYSLVLTISSLISISIFGPAEQSFVRFYYDYLKIGLSKTYIKALYKFIFIIFSLFLLLTIALSIYSQFVSWKFTIITIIIYSIYIFISSCSNLLNSILNVLRRRKTNTLYQVIEKCLILLLLLLIFKYCYLNAETALIVIIIATSLVVLAKILNINKHIPDNTVNNLQTLNLSNKIYSVLLTFGLPFAIWGIFGWIQSNSERWIIAYNFSTSEVGIYSLMAALANYMISLPSGIIGQFLQPIIYENISNHKTNEVGYKYVKILILIIAILSIVMTLFSLFFGEELILIVSNKQYTHYWYILFLLCIGFGIFQISQAMTTIGLIKNIPKIYIFPKITSGIIAIVLNIILIKHYGLKGIPIAIIITNILYIVLIYSANSKIRFR